MRRVKRIEKPEAIRLLSLGVRPTAVSKQMNIPLSTITTWNKSVRATQNKTAKNSNSWKNERLKNTAKIINEAEARISTFLLKIINPCISDEIWMETTQLISAELKKVVLLTI